MEKILLTLNGEHQNTYAIDFACFLARLTHSRLTGVFLEGARDGTGTRENLREPITVDDYIMNERPNDAVDAAVRQFREACVCRDVPARIHRDRGVPMQELLDESRFADLVVLDPETSLENTVHRSGSQIEHFLHTAECPVIIAPFSFDILENIYFAYDGSESAVYAIKQFTYLFPELHNRSVSVICVAGTKDESIPGQFKIKEWLNAHYQDVRIETLTGNPSDALFAFLLEKKNAIVVLGAYGRGSLSRVLIPSHARLLMKAVNLPLFIAHK